MKEIVLSQGKIAIVDDEDFGFLNRFTWCVRHCVDRDYAVTAKNFDGKYHATFLHRMIMNAPSHMVVDHVNGNPLDNRKENLRICSQLENSRNRQANKGQKYKGVALINIKGVKRPKTNRRFFASIFYQGKSVRIGYFETENEAAKAYDEKARKLFGEFANLNFPEPELSKT